MASLELSRMYKEYGKNYNYKKCGACCNYRSPTGGCCIAYGEDYCTSWPADSQACDLYNRPFAALRPRRKELGAFYETHKRKPAEVGDDRQIALF